MRSPDDCFRFSPRQCRAARALLDLELGVLAAGANLSESELAEFEAGARDLTPNEAYRVGVIIYNRGVRPLRENLAGEGVRFRTPQRGSWLDQVIAQDCEELRAQR